MIDFFNPCSNPTPLFIILVTLSIISFKNRLNSSSLLLIIFVKTNKGKKENNITEQIKARGDSITIKTKLPINTPVITEIIIKK